MGCFLVFLSTGMDLLKNTSLICTSVDFLDIFSSQSNYENILIFRVVTFIVSYHFFHYTVGSIYSEK